MKTLITKATMALLLASTFISCSKENVTESLVPSSASIASLNSTNSAAHYDEFIISDRAFIPCVNNGNGEWVFITGKGQLNPHAGGIEQYQITLSELIVTGEKTGEVYSFTHNRVYNLNSENQFNLSVFSYKGNSVELIISVPEQNASGTRGYVSLIKISC